MSKGAISVAVHYLEALELIRYTKIEGTRRRLVHLEPKQFVQYLRRRMSYFRAFAAALQSVHGDTQHAQEVQGIADLFRRLDVAVTSILTTREVL